MYVSRGRRIGIPEAAESSQEPQKSDEQPQERDTWVRWNFWDHRIEHVVVIWTFFSFIPFGAPFDKYYQLATKYQGKVQAFYRNVHGDVQDQPFLVEIEVVKSGIFLKGT